MRTNSYTYQTVSGHVSGAFNIYQGKNGCIYLLMGKSITTLTFDQVDDLSIDLYSLRNFDHEAFLTYYKREAK